ncbi:MAG: hypothetical protein K2N49_00095 [Ruminococcus sp.]|nr:hypothetical protein [Ruminococcus sp.]MDE7225260.1 hypothetical protein [Ruminococcus sp.]
MIKEILSGKTCAECRMCCIFDRYDIWETPVFTEEIKNKVLEYVPDAPFAKVGTGYMLNAGEITDGQIYSCPALTENGCILGDGKPFDCRIWPFRVMNRDGIRVIAVSSLCDEVHNQTHEKLRNFLKKGLAEKIFSYADKYPETVKPYYDNYTVIFPEEK